ncbi:hypothetical protein BCR37DRAFT_386529 [Protomyces lactucae-debilis]|uniref:Uncharacterized protein n=1 Tax=Protomyces lactucae-debilis TaxID=2754530 RepID=A0A1Y2FL99_PROLT|nr:uncharacterized protein BCR37DRAFT_386529 [Protomyces lactucae-debilis]ORY84357.1 hypothetical protein BCR37DRAFT_386529 [Protomyces lactucae-debilis]
MQISSLDYVLIIAASAQLMQQASAKSTHGTGKKKHTKPVAKEPVYTSRTKEPVYTSRDLPAITPTSLYWYLSVMKDDGNITYVKQKLANQNDCGQVSECYWGLQNKTITYHPKTIVSYSYNMTGHSDTPGLFYCEWVDPDNHDNTGEWIRARPYPMFHQCSPYASTTLEKGEDGKEKNVTRIIPNCATPY